MTEAVVRFEEKLVADRFAGRTVIVTGAASGIGRATALRIAREGGRVIATDWSESALKELVDAHPGLDLVPVGGDVSDDAAVAAIVTAAGTRIGASAPEGHLESDILARGATEAQARERVGAMKLNEVKGVLDALIARSDAGTPKRKWWDAMAADSDHEHEGA